MDPGQEPNQQPDAPDKSVMEQIRLRRIAKLGAAPAPKPDESSRPTTPSSSTQEAEPSPSSNSQTTPTITPAAASKAPAPKMTPASSVSADSSQKRTAAKIEDRTPATQPQNKRPNTTQNETVEEYSDRLLSQIFRISVDSEQTTDPQGHSLTFLPDLAEELSGEGLPLRLSKDRLDSALMEAASLHPQNIPLLTYLSPCFKRAHRALTASKEGPGEKREVLQEARRLAVSNILFALTLPDLFGRPDADDIVPFLLKGAEHDDSISPEFVKEAIGRFDEDEQYPAIFSNAMASMSQALSRLTMVSQYRPYIEAMAFYTRFPPLMKAVSEHPNFLAGNTGPEVENNSILGPFFKLSPLQSEIVLSYFPQPRSLDKQRALQAQQTLQTVLRVHQEELFGIVNAFIRADTEVRSRVLDWFALGLNKNHKRRAMQVRADEVSSDGFMINLTVVLDRFCEPFLDTTYSKIDKIEVDYFRRRPRVNIRDETKINADQAVSDAFYDKTDPKSSNFVSEVFFLTLAAHHYGSGAATSKLKVLDRDIKYYEKHLAAMEAERHKFQHVPQQLALYEQSMKRHTTVLEKAIATKNAIEGVFTDEKLQGLSLRFMRFVAIWLLRLASQSSYTPDKNLKIPLPESVPDTFACLPEYAMQDVVDNFKFTWRYIPHIMPNAVGSEMIALCVAFLESSHYVKNPYLKSSLVTLLFSGTWSLRGFMNGVLGDLLTTSKFANEYLLHALMKFYIEAESTGAHNQFYDKFNIRYEIFQVIKCVWTNDVYKRQLTRESKVNRQFFIQFVNLLLNDATYVLDESLTKFPKIHNLQDELRDTSLPQEDRDKKMEELQTLEGQATSYMQLANETLSMMKLFTSALSEAFTMPEIVQRLASMLNYNLESLAGTKMGQLKVNDPLKYHFQPKVLLGNFIEIYLNLASSQAFVDAVAADGRSYKPEVFEKARHILGSRQILDPGQITQLTSVMSKFQQSKVLADQAEMDLGEVPAEFEDPILGDLMKDPVILPSKHIVDRSTIVQHLLSDPKDPFTRQPMTIEDAIPATELKEQIEAWKAGRIEAARSRLDAMDTTEG